MNPLDLISVVFLWVSATMHSIDLVCEVQYCSIVFERRNKVIIFVEFTLISSNLSDGFIYTV